MSAAPRQLVAIVGNPNTGKTTLFNQLTGQTAPVGNYPGITVERRVGPLRGGDVPVDLVDVPGTYSLHARSVDEQVTLRAVLGLDGVPPPDRVAVVLDVNQLSRTLYIALQIAEFGVPVLLVVNMIDEAGPDAPDADAVAAATGLPTVAVSGRSGAGLDTLRARLGTFTPGTPPALSWSVALEADVDRLLPLLPTTWGPADRQRALGRWCLGSIDADDELDSIPAALRAAVGTIRADAARAGRDLDLELIGPRWAWIDARDLAPPPPPRTLTERLDAVLLHPVAGFAAFLAIMLTVFQALFTGADPLIGVVEAAVGWTGEAAAAALPAGLATELLVEGVIGGVGNVVVFLPQILLLFFFIGLLEDSGYMARAAYLMDRVMRTLGLHGRAFVPMLSGFACAVPAILATRTMERQRDRLLTMMVVPLMTCSARLPVYTLIIAALFAPTGADGGLPVQGLVMMAMYLFSTVIALLAAWALGRTVLKGPKVPLLLELPPYRLPALRGVASMMMRRTKAFLSEAGTVILAATVVMWALLRFPGTPEPEGGLDAASPEVAATWQAAQLERSFAGQFGHAMEPVMRPLGFDWKANVGIVGAFAAREVFVSTMGLVYGVGDDVDEESVPLREKLREATHPDGSPVWTPLSGVSLMIFFALACQCMSTLAVVKRETRGWRWPAFLFAYMTTLAWITSFLVFQGGRLLGFS